MDGRERRGLSVPHAQHRVPTGPREQVRERVEPSEPPDDVHEQYDPMTFALAQKLAAGAFSVEDLLVLNRLISRETVVQTRQDDKLRVDTSLSLLESKIESMQTKADQKIARARNFWRGISAFLLAVAGGVGTVAATCANAYDDARVDAIIPAKRAEEKAVRADEVATELDRRIKASEDRHETTEKKLGEIERSVHTANAVLLKIAEKLDAGEKSGKDER